MQYTEPELYHLSREQLIIKTVKQLKKYEEQRYAYLTTKLTQTTLCGFWPFLLP
jgi:hypothetical protein